MGCGREGIFGAKGGCSALRIFLVMEFCGEGGFVGE